MSELPATQNAIQFVGPDQLVVNSAKPVDPVGPHQVLMKVEACGICFSDTKLLHAFADHPRKEELAAGLTAAELASIPSYHPGAEPTVPGHEPVGRIVAVGDRVAHFAVGDRVLVQADWKHLPTDRSNGAFGYNFEGALQEYVVIDERCVVAPDGEEYLLRVSDGPAAAAIGLVEPWATVEGAYASGQRNALRPGGRLLVVVDAGVEPRELDGLEGITEVGEVVVVGVEPRALGLTATRADRVADLAGQEFDDVVYFGADSGILGQLADLLARYGLINVVLGGARLDGPVSVDVGRIHYDFIRYCGTTGSDPKAGYRWLPTSNELRPGDVVAIIGAAGPMGMMHTVRTVISGIPGLNIEAADVSDERLAHLEATVGPIAAAHQVPLRCTNTSLTPLAGGYGYVVCLVPVPAVFAQAVGLAGRGGIVNAFAGIPAGTRGLIDLQHVIEDQILLTGTSGSDNNDMATVLRRIEAGVIDTTISLDAVCGMAGFPDAIEAVRTRTSGGKIVVYPTLYDLPLIRLGELAAVLPQVAAKLDDGRWTVAAEQALLASRR